jgi:hypothetical protein
VAGMLMHHLTDLLARVHHVHACMYVIILIMCVRGLAAVHTTWRRRTSQHRAMQRGDRARALARRIHPQYF